MVSSAWGPPPGVARITGCAGPPMMAVSGMAGGVGGGGCHAGIKVVDSWGASEPAPIPAAIVAATDEAGGSTCGGCTGGCHGGGTGGCDSAGAAGSAAAGSALSAAPAASACDVADACG